MIFHGFQKLTLLDYPGKAACTLFTGGCNFRCPFCHNAILVEHPEEAETVNMDEIFSVLNKRKNVLDGVAITGGEPTMQKDLPDFIREVKKMGFLVKLDTNGSFPDRLSAMLDEHLLDYVAMDIKNTKEKYGITVGLPKFDMKPIETSVELLKNSGIDFEFRTTIVSEFHTPDDIEEVAKWLTGTKHYFLQNFVDSGNLLGENLHACSKATLLEMQERAKKYIPETELRGVSV